MKKDVILTIFANSSNAPCNKWANEFFSEPPIILTVPGSGGRDFRANIIRWAKTGDLFAAALKELAPQLKNIEIRRRGLVTFSAGWAGADELFRFEKERNRLDAYLLLDGCHAWNLDNWVEFGARAANMDAFMVMAHSEIQPPNFPSAGSNNKKIFKESFNINQFNLNSPKYSFPLPDYITNLDLVNSKESISIHLQKSGSLPAIKKTWKRDPLKDFETIGNLTRLGYGGNDRPDHVYIAWYVANKLWMWLGEYWT